MRFSCCHVCFLDFRLLSWFLGVLLVKRALLSVSIFHDHDYDAVLVGLVFSLYPDVPVLGLNPFVSSLLMSVLHFLAKSSSCVQLPACLSNCEAQTPYACFLGILQMRMLTFCFGEDSFVLYADLQIQEHPHTNIYIYTYLHTHTHASSSKIRFLGWNLEGIFQKMTMPFLGSDQSYQKLIMFLNKTCNKYTVWIEKNRRIQGFKFYLDHKLNYTLSEKIHS